MSLPAMIGLRWGVWLALVAPVFAQEQAMSPAGSAPGYAASQETVPASLSQAGSGVTNKLMRVARLTFVAGAVRVERVDNTETLDAPGLNTPLTEGTRLVTGDYGQAEVEFEDGSVARLTPRSTLSLDVLNVADGTARTQITLLGGLAYFELRKAPGYSYTLQVLGVQIQAAANATLRINADESPATISVLAGEIRVEHAGKEAGDGFRATVRQGESLRGDAGDDSRYFLNAQVTPESWDQWNESRDGAAADEADLRTLARDGFAGQQGYGWSDLDANGSWYDVPGQGQTWQPAAADEAFDPYGFGSWVYVNTSYAWVSGYSWGWTPFRCGRWNYANGFGWGWQPGRSCGALGFAGQEGGYGGVHVYHGPPRYAGPTRPVAPFPGAGRVPVHPIVIVHGPDGARPPLKGGPVTLGKVRLEPLRPVGDGPGRGNAVLGAALSRDFPVDRTTGKPVFGREAIGAAGQDVQVVGGWVPVQGRPTGAMAPGPGGVRQTGNPLAAGQIQGERPRPATGTALPMPAARAPVQPGAPMILPVPVPEPGRGASNSPVPNSTVPGRGVPGVSAPLRVAPAPVVAPAPARSAPAAVPAPAATSAPRSSPR